MNYKSDYQIVKYGRDAVAQAVATLSVVDIETTDISCDAAYDVAQAQALLAQALVLLNRAAA